MSQIRIHQIGDHVYVRDVQYEWLPAIVEDVQEHKVLVRIVLPKDWLKTTIRQDTTHDDDDHNDEDDNNNISQPQTIVDVVDGEQRWVKLVDYFNHHLPFQNWEDNDGDDATDENYKTTGCNDMSQLQHINEAELLYQIKKRYCSLDQPYTRITTAPVNSSSSSSNPMNNKTTTMMVAVNPCRYIPSLYTIEKQQYYIQYYMKRQQQHQSSCSYVSCDGTSYDLQICKSDEIIC
jgi:hypothetical protein